MFFQSEDESEIAKNFKQDVINLVLVAEHSKIDINSLIAAANTKGTMIAGGIFPMVISEDQNYESGIVLKYIATAEPPYLIKANGPSDLSAQLPEMDSDTQSCIILFDGLMTDIPRMLHDVYEKYWDKLAFVGGGAGSLTLQQTPCIFNNEGIFQDVALLIPSSLRANSGVKHGWTKIAGPYIANKTAGNQILELNWRPAFEVYKEVVEETGDLNFSSTDFFDISKGFPFGIQKEGQEVIVRDPIAVEGNVLTCVGPVSQNVSLYILKGEKDHLINSAKEAAETAMQSKNYKESLLIDCISRVLYLGSDFQEELAAIQKPMKSNIPLEGALTLGEVSSSIEGLLELYNKTTVVTTFS